MKIINISPGKIPVESSAIPLEFTIHQADYDAVQMMARLVGLDTAEFCRLAIHRYTSDLSSNQWNILGLAGRKTIIS